MSDHNPLFWKGKPVVLLEHEELLEAFIHLATEVNRLRERVTELNNQIDKLFTARSHK